MGVIAEETVLIRADTGMFATQMAGMSAAAGSAGTGISKLGTLAGAAAVGGIAAAGVGAIALGKGLVDSVNKAADFEQKLHVLWASTDHAGNSMKDVSDLAIKLGADVKLPGVSAADAADAMLQLGKSGFNVSEAMKAARGTLLLSTAAETDAGNAAKVVTQNLNAFHLTAKDTNKIVDQMAGFMNQTGTDFAAFTDSLSYVAAPAHAAGQSFKETAAQLAILSQNGIEGSMAGTGLRQILSRLAAPSELLTANFEDIGVSLKDSNGEFVGMKSVIEQMEPALSKMTKAQRIAFFEQNFGKTAMNQANIVLSAGKDKYAEITAAIEKKGQADKLAAAHMEGFKGAMAQLGSSLESLQIEIGLKLLPVLTRFVMWLTAELPTAVAIVTRVIGGMTAVFNTIAPVVEDIVQVFRNNWNTIMLIVNGVMTEIRGIINVVMGLIHGDWERVWEGMTQIVSGVFDQLRGLLTLAITALGTIAEAIGEAILNGIIGILEGIPGLLGDIIGALPGLFTGAAGLLGDAAAALAGAALEAITTALSGLGELIAGWIGEGITAIGNAVGEAGTAAAGIATAIVTAITTGVTGLGTAVAGGISDVATAITNAIAGITLVAASFGRGIVTGLVNGLVNIVTEVMGEVAKVGTAVAGYVTTAATEAAKIGAAIIRGVVSGLQGIATAAIGVIDNITTEIGKFATNVFNNAEHIGARIIAGVRSGLAGIGGEALEIIDNIANVVNQFAQDVWQSATRIGARIITGVLSGLSGLFTAVAHSIQNQIGSAIGWAGDHIPGSGEGPAERAARNHLGTPVAEGVISGFLSGIGGFKDAVQASVTDGIHGVDTSMPGGGDAFGPFGAGRTTGYEAAPLALDDGGLVERIGELIDEIRASRGDDSSVTVIASGGANAAVLAARR